MKRPKDKPSSEMEDRPLLAVEEQLVEALGESQRRRIRRALVALWADALLDKRAGRR